MLIMDVSLTIHVQDSIAFHWTLPRGQIGGGGGGYETCSANYTHHDGNVKIGSTGSFRAEGALSMRAPENIVEIRLS